MTDEEALELLTDDEVRFYGDDYALALECARRHERELRKQNGPMGRLRSLACGDLGDSTLFPEYRRVSQLSAMVAQVREEERVHMQCRTERSLIDGSIAGVRVTLVSFNQ